jgi:hypothetical protein
VIRNPNVGFDQQDVFVPGAQYQIRRAATGEVVQAGSPVAWLQGVVEASSGDTGWWFDFSPLTATGRYFIFDVERNRRSPTFSIDPNVYRNVLRAAVRMYFYQRSGYAKTAPWADPCWSDGAAYLGPHQDGEARDVTDPNNASKVRDMRGGWFDAGDTNKYVTFAVQPVHQLLTAYLANPVAFTDDFGIPESGNGIPDVIDEVKWEIDWLKRMQFPDGSVALKVGSTVYRPASPPTSDVSSRYYVPGCTSSTIAAAGMFAHAAYVFRRFPSLARNADDLRDRAARAWDNYQRAPARQTSCDSGVVHAGNADLPASDQQALAAEAAIYLYATTSDVAYDDYLQAHYRDMRPYHDTGWSRYQADQGESLLFYTDLPGAAAAARKSILDDKRADVVARNQIYGFEPDDDLYRAFMHDPQYHWGSNNPRANYGNTNVDAVTHDLGLPDPQRYRSRALEILHYFHGVNPFGMVYLSNMYSLGATFSVNRIYHTWFMPKSDWNDARESRCGPPPGYVPGGPNADAVRNGVPATLLPPAGQPPQKSYRDWNEGYPESSWAVTEPAIYYQSAYIRLLSAFTP